MACRALLVVLLVPCSRATGPEPASIGPAADDYADAAIDSAVAHEASAPVGDPEAMREAQRLFVEARNDFAENKLAEARSKFQRSYDLHPAIGTLVNLAECESKMGDIAKACAHWAMALQKIRATSAPDSAREKLVVERMATAKCPA